MGKPYTGITRRKISTGRARHEKQLFAVEIAGELVVVVSALLPAAGGFAGLEFRRAMIRYAAFVGGVVLAAADGAGIERIAAACGLCRKRRGE